MIQEDHRQEIIYSLPIDPENKMRAGLIATFVILVWNQAFAMPRVVYEHGDGDVVRFTIRAEPNQGADGTLWRISWNAIGRMPSFGFHTARLIVNAEGFARGTSILSVQDEPRLYRGIEFLSFQGVFFVQRDDWVATRALVVHMEEVPSPVKISSLIYKRLSVLPGTPLALFKILPIQWKVVLTTGDQAIRDNTQLLLNLWDGDGNTIGQYPVMSSVKLGPNSAVVLSSTSYVQEDVLARTSGITMDAVPREP